MDATVAGVGSIQSRFSWAMCLRHRFQTLVTESEVEVQNGNLGISKMKMGAHSMIDYPSRT